MGREENRREVEGGKERKDRKGKGGKEKGKAGQCRASLSSEYGL